MGKVFNKKTGDLGESIAAKYLEQKGYAVLERNYKRKFGEIDIIAQKGKIIHFVEVKSVSRENRAGHRPEELVHQEKLYKIRKTGDFYLVSREMADTEAQIDVITVHLDWEKRIGHCELIEAVG